MWALYAFGSALFAGLTAVLAKCGIRKTDSTLATAIRTIVVLLFSWLMVFIVGSQDQLSAIGGRTLLFLVLSGLAAGASWLCYFHALQIGDINRVVPVDKSSTVLTILLAVIFLHESLSLARGAGVVLIAAGTYLMIEKKQSDGPASVVAPIDKLSILVTILFSYLVFHERLSKKAGLGLAILAGGTLLMLV